MARYMRSELIPRIGQTFDQWAVIVPGTIRCVCRCACGRQKEVVTRNLIDGKSTKCRSCAAKGQGDRLWDDKQPLKLRMVVKAAIQRCTVPSSQSYSSYGGRGIKIHPTWLDDPRLFVSYLEALPGWSDPSLVLDRVNNDGNYEPGNLRFATRSQSSANQRPRRSGCRRRYFGRKTK